MNALLAALLLAADPLVAGPEEVQVTGWSADGQRFSVRSIVHFEGGMEGESVQSCPGYVDHRGQSFDGSLTVAAYDGGKLVQSWVVQDFPKCTPPEKAKETLAAAKAKFAELGIDLTAKGRTLSCKGTCDLAPGVKLELETKTRTKENEEEARGRITGTQKATLIRGGKRVELWKISIDQSFETVTSSGLTAGFGPVEVSPGGKTFLVRYSRIFHSMRSGYRSYTAAGLFKTEP